MVTRIQYRRDTAANWVTANPVLAQGEAGYETDTNLLKIGDGVTGWVALPYPDSVTPESIAANLTTDAVEAKLPTRLEEESLTATILTGGSSWIESRGIDVSSRPAPDDIPVIAWSDAPATELISPVVYKPSICGTGVAVTGWDGKNDPNIRYFSGTFRTTAGAYGDLSLVGETKPGGAAQYATWPIVFAFNTFAAAIELTIYSARPSHYFLIEVNGRMVSDTLYRQPDDQATSAARVKINFPAKSYGSPRQIRIWSSGAFGLAEIRVPSGDTITKPATTTGKRLAFIGDSYSNGAGSSAAWPDQGTSNTETFVPRLFRLMGATDMILAGIGGAGFVAGTTTSSYSTRINAVLAMSPDVLIFNGSINDGVGAGAIQAAVESALATVASVPKVYVIGTLLTGYSANRAAVKAGTLAAGRTFIDLGAFMSGTGKVTAPTGDGNNDYFRMADGVHPTLDAHRALARKLFTAISA